MALAKLQEESHPECVHTDVKATNILPTLETKVFPEVIKIQPPLAFRVVCIFKSIVILFPDTSIPVEPDEFVGGTPLDGFGSISDESVQAVKNPIPKTDRATETLDFSINSLLDLFKLPLFITEKFSIKSKLKYLNEIRTQGFVGLKEIHFFQ